MTDQLISLTDKLKENSNYLNLYADNYFKTHDVSKSQVCSEILSDFEESPDYIRKRISTDYKDETKFNNKSKLTRLKSKISRLQNELTITQAMYETMVYAKK
jgi:hypothetical protein